MEDRDGRILERIGVGEKRLDRIDAHLKGFPGPKQIQLVLNHHLAVQTPTYSHFIVHHTLFLAQVAYQSVINEGVVRRVEGV